jgi:hypothetical protein
MALSVVANARHLIVDIAAQLSIDRFRGETELDPGPLLTWPDPDTGWGAHIAWTVDDLFFVGQSFWLVLARDSDGVPAKARRLPPGSVAVTLGTDYAAMSRILEVSIGGEPVAPDDVIHIDGPSRGILVEGAAIILSALQLQASADRSVNVPLPAGTLTNTGQEIGPDDAAEIVANFDAAREAGSTAFLQGLTFERTQIDSADLQLVEAMAAMDTRLARMCNVPVGMVAASPSGNARVATYANVGMQLTLAVQQCVAPLLCCIEDAISNQALPRGQTCRFDTGDWLRFASVSVPISQPAGTDAPELSPEGVPQ